MVNYKLVIAGVATGLGLMVAGCGGNTPVKVPNTGPTSTSSPTSTNTPSPSSSPTSSPTVSPLPSNAVSPPPVVVPSGPYLNNIENSVKSAVAMSGGFKVISNKIEPANGVSSYVVVFSGEFWSNLVSTCENQATAGPVTVDKYTTITVTSPVSSNGGEISAELGTVTNGQTVYTCPGNNQP